jgi:hypothetical protein
MAAAGMRRYSAKPLSRVMPIGSKLRQRFSFPARHCSQRPQPILGATKTGAGRQVLDRLADLYDLADDLMAGNADGARWIVPVAAGDDPPVGPASATADDAKEGLIGRNPRRLPLFDAQVARTVVDSRAHYERTSESETGRPS